MKLVRVFTLPMENLMVNTTLQLRDVLGTVRLPVNVLFDRPCFCRPGNSSTWWVSGVRSILRGCPRDWAGASAPAKSLGHRSWFCFYAKWGRPVFLKITDDFHNDAAHRGYGRLRICSKKMKDVLALLWQGIRIAPAVLSNAMSIRHHATDLEKVGPLEIL